MSPTSAINQVQASVTIPEPKDPRRRRLVVVIVVRSARTKVIQVAGS
jgi:hypothetical protein